MLNFFYYWCGIGFLFLAKASNFLRGYKNPKPFSHSQLDLCINHDMGIVNHWLNMLRQYNSNCTIANKRILELGPGSDLGIALYLLSMKIHDYTTIDVNRLIDNVPENFYAKILEKIKKENQSVNIDFLKKELNLFKEGKHCKINYIINKDFNIMAELEKGSIDFVFSSAAFEHFDDVEKSISQLSKVVKSGGISVITIDMKTHTRWIRDKDPNNIYRYSDFIYNKFYFRGIPNRIRPYQYIQYFERNGWDNIVLIPNIKDETLNGIKHKYHKQFSHIKNQMELQTITICATRK